MKYFKALAFAIMSTGVVVPIAVSSLRQEAAHADVGAKPQAPPRGNPALVISPLALAKNPIGTVRATRERLAADVLVVGSVTYDRNVYAVVGPLVSGRIVRLDARVGDLVKAGQVLGTVESADVGQAQAEFLSARARAHAADLNAARERELAEQHISSMRERELAEAQAVSESAQMAAAVERLRAFGLGGGEIRGLEQGAGSGGRVPLRAPIDGTVITRDVTLGQALERATDAFVVADLSRLWVLLDIYEKDLMRVHVGQEVELRADTVSGDPIRARVAYVTPLVDEKTRTANVRVEIEQHGGRLRPGQFVTARLIGDTEHSAVEAIAIPRKAIQTVEGKSVVFRSGPSGFERRYVELGFSGGDLVEVTSGVAEGDEVAVEGAFLLKSELQR